MTYKLFLDDERYPGQVTWVSFPVGPYEIVRSYDEFVKFIVMNGLPEFVCFDHDLADQHYQAMSAGSDDYGPEKTGYHCAVWLVDLCHENNLPFPDYVVHSMNPVGSLKIHAYIKSARENNYIT